SPSMKGIMGLSGTYSLPSCRRIFSPSFGISYFWNNAMLAPSLCFLQTLPLLIFMSLFSICLSTGMDMGTPTKDKRSDGHHHFYIATSNLTSFDAGESSSTSEHLVPLIDRNVGCVFRPHIFCPRPNEAVVGILFENVGRP